MKSPALENLDLVIAEMERERANVLPKLRVAKGAEAELYTRALKMLDDKLAECRKKRAELLERHERLERVLAIGEELKRLRASPTPNRDRIAALVAELESLRSPRN